MIAVGPGCESLSVERMAFRIPAAPEVIPRLGTPLRGWAPMASALERERAQHKAASDFSREIGKATRLERREPEQKREWVQSSETR